MQTQLTDIQKALLHTQCPVCKENELSALDSIYPDEPFLWCANCDTTIDGLGKVEEGDAHKTEKISYAELARRVGDCILNNELQSQLAGDYEFELFNGDDSYCYKHETKEECQKNDHECDYESTDVYQTYIITQGGAEYLQRNTNEIVYYCEKLELYLWGITHYGTSWSGVYTTIKTNIA